MEKCVALNAGRHDDEHVRQAMKAAGGRSGFNQG